MSGKISNNILNELSLGFPGLVLIQLNFGACLREATVFYLVAFYQINSIILIELCVCAAELQQLAVILGR